MDSSQSSTEFETFSPLLPALFHGLKHAVVSVHARTSISANLTQGNQSVEARDDSMLFLSSGVIGIAKNISSIAPLADYVFTKLSLHAASLKGESLSAAMAIIHDPAIRLCIVCADCSLLGPIFITVP